ncbi:hypothetical protein QFZ99_004209 [Paraburkholderia atlantica]|uniref:hypothetical protein n=1 Tax=Paraburkholderia atlantica TaxID=2654982 RepID=UPI003D1B1E42
MANPRRFVLKSMDDEQLSRWARCILASDVAGVEAVDQLSDLETLRAVHFRLASRVASLSRVVGVSLLSEGDSFNRSTAQLLVHFDGGYSLLCPQPREQSSANGTASVSAHGKGRGDILYR